VTGRLDVNQIRFQHDAGPMRFCHRGLIVDISSTYFVWWECQMSAWSVVPSGTRQQNWSDWTFQCERLFK